MFTQAINQMIDSVSDAKENFVNTFYTQESVKEMALAYVGAERTMAKNVVSATDDFVTAQAEMAKKAFKL